MEASFRSAAETHRTGSSTMPTAAFLSREVFQEEQRRIFSRRWLCVGRESDLPNPGDFLQVRPVGRSILITRDENGNLHGLYNVCRHRGAQLCTEESGNLSRTIQCAYHGWTYTLDGRLLAAPQMKGCDGFELADHALHRVWVDTWEGFVFVNLHPAPEPLDVWLGPLVGRFSRFNLPALRRADRIEYDLAVNWKLLFQNYSECQHCPLVHPELSEISPFRSGANDLSEGPFLGGYMEIVEEAASMSLSGGAVGVPVGALPPEDHHRVYYYSIFPNLLLSLHPDYAMAHVIWPLAPDRSRVVCEWHFHPDSLADPRYDPSDAVSFWDTTNRQDWHVCELNQKGIESGGYRPGPYFPSESLLAAFDEEYRRHMEDESP
jgi:glycine betaine catabolism A